MNIVFDGVSEVGVGVVIGVLAAALFVLGLELRVWCHRRACSAGVGGSDELR